MACSGRSSARQDRCEQRRQATRARGDSRPFWDAVVGTRMRCAILCASTPLKHWPTTTRFWSLTKPVFSSKEKDLAALAVSIRAEPARCPDRQSRVGLQAEGLRARSQIVRLVFLPAMFHVTAMRSSIGRFICPRPRCSVPECDGARLSLTRQDEDALWQAFFTAAPERRREFEPNSKRRKRRPVSSPVNTASTSKRS